MPDLKTIEYRGGLVTFSIPSTWREEYVPEGGGTFYEDSSESGTLRLNVLTMESPRELTKHSVIDVLSGRGDERKIERLANGNAVAKYVVPSQEEGQELSIYYWEVANALPPRHIRLGVFSYTVLTSRSADSVVQTELQLLDTLISQAEFAKVMGVSGEYPTKPWWKFW